MIKDNREELISRLRSIHGFDYLTPDDKISLDGHFSLNDLLTITNIMKKLQGIDDDKLYIITSGAGSEYSEDMAIKRVFTNKEKAEEFVDTVPAFNWFNIEEFEVKNDFTLEFDYYISIRYSSKPDFIFDIKRITYLDGETSMRERHRLKV